MLHIPALVHGTRCCCLHVPHPRSEAARRELKPESGPCRESAVVACTLQTALERIQQLELTLTCNKNDEDAFERQLRALLPVGDTTQIVLSVASAIASHPSMLDTLMNVLTKQTSHTMKEAACDVLALVLDGVEGGIVALQCGLQLLHACQLTQQGAEGHIMLQFAAQKLAERLSSCQTLQSHSVQKLVEDLQQWTESSSDRKDNTHTQPFSRNGE